MKIYIGSDHAGFEMKEKLKIFLAGLGYEVEDKGAFELNNDDDYPDFITPVTEAIAKDNLGAQLPNESVGIILGGSGQGEAMCANKVKGIRCAVYYGAPNKNQIDMSGHSLDMIASTRMHNHANILSLGARFISEEEAEQVVKTFLETAYSEEERHVRRVEKF